MGLPRGGLPRGVDLERVDINVLLLLLKQDLYKITEDQKNDLRERFNNNEDLIDPIGHSLVTESDHIVIEHRGERVFGVYTFDNIKCWIQVSPKSPMNRHVLSIYNGELKPGSLLTVKQFLDIKK